MNALPSIVIVSSSNTKPKSIIKLITKGDPKKDSGLIIEPWTIDTKYYSAQVNIIGLDSNYIRDELFNNQVEALVIHMDTNNPSGLEALKDWETLENECEPEVKLLLANYCNEETKITKSEAINWCLKRGYELIELYPFETQNIQNSEQDIIPEKIGINRVIEALQAHTWSNLIMKSKKISASNKSEASTHPLQQDNFSEELLEGKDDFTELFSQLHLMKDSLQSLSTTQRKQCAEQMVTAFWKAIGGDEEELLDL